MSTITTPLSNAIASKNNLLDSNKKTTVFIGNISDYTTDEFMQNLMGKCGRIENWKRVLGSNGKYQSFGFCEYQDQEAGLRAMRLLNGFKIGDKPLVVKVDAKTRALLDEYEIKNKFQSNKRTTQQKYQLPVSAMTFVRAEQDNKSQKEIEKLLEENSQMLSGNGGITTNTTTFEEGQVSDDIADPQSLNDSRRGQPISSMYMDEDDIAHEKRRQERKKLEKAKIFKDKVKRWETYESYLDDELHHYQGKLKRKLKRRSDYEDKLRKFIINYNDDVDDEKYYRHDAWDEKLTFRSEELENDEQDVQEELEEQKKIREKEIQEKVSSLKIELPKLNSVEKSDKPPKPKECDDIPDKTSSFNMDVIMVRPVAAIEVEDGINHNEESPGIDLSSSQSKLSSTVIDSSFDKVPNNMIKTSSIDKKQEWAVVNDKVEHQKSSDSSEITKEKKTFGIKLSNTSNNANSSAQLSNLRIIGNDVSQLSGESGHDDIYVKKKTRLTMITDAEHKEVPLVELPPGYHAESLTPSEKKKRIKKIISSIPTAKKELFAYKVMWDHVDKRLMDERIKPWVTRKIKELIGIEETTLVDFICTKVYQQSKPEEIIGAISMILESEAEEFTIKLWRFLIYEATAKMYGLNECSKPLK